MSTPKKTTPKKNTSTPSKKKLRVTRATAVSEVNPPDSATNPATGMGGHPLRKY